MQSYALVGVHVAGLVKLHLQNASGDWNTDMLADINHRIHRYADNDPGQDLASLTTTSEEVLDVVMDYLEKGGEEPKEVLNDIPVFNRETGV